VLVVDADATTRSRLTVWLERFGFRVHAEGNLDQGRAMIAARCFATGFVGAPLAGEAGQAALALLEAARDLGTESPCRMVYIDDGRSATDRVRARFAGFDAVLDAPISRGSVARTIESLGYALPRDERRA
jgi:DNA-binding response OmpR family regulator